MLLLKSRGSTGKKISATQDSGQKVYSLFTSENDGCNCKDGDSKLGCGSRKGVTIVATCVVGVRSMDAQTNVIPEENEDEMGGLYISVNK